MKPTDKSNYLHFKSTHPNHCKVAIPYGQFIRIDGICTQDDDYTRNCEAKAKHFIRRGYPTKIVREAYRKCLLKQEEKKREKDSRGDENKKEKNNKLENEHKLFIITKY